MATGLNSAFLHCSELAVHEGDAVRQGQYIGRIGMTGRATGPHLHWWLKWRDAGSIRSCSPARWRCSDPIDSFRTKPIADTGNN